MTCRHVIEKMLMSLKRFFKASIIAYTLAILILKLKLAGYREGLTLFFCKDNHWYQQY